MKTYKILIACIFLFASFSIRSLAVEISTYVVDGVHNNREVVIYDHDPIFSWEYNASISSFSPNILKESTTIWTVAESTNSSNTRYLGEDEGYRSFKKYSSLTFPTPLTTLTTNTTYNWNITVYGIDGSSDRKEDRFTTVISSVSLSDTRSDLQVDYNNPFNPYRGQTTKFRYMVSSSCRVKLRIYTISGEYVATLSEHSAYKDMVYTSEWNGCDYLENLVPSGIYLVNLDFDEPKGITRKVIVTNR